MNNNFSNVEIDKNTLLEVNFDGDQYTLPYKSKIIKNGKIFLWSNRRRKLDSEKLPDWEIANYKWRLDAKISMKGINKLKELLTNFEVNINNNKSNLKITFWKGLIQSNIYIENSNSQSYSFKLYHQIIDIINENTIENGVPIIQQY